MWIAHWQPRTRCAGAWRSRVWLWICSQCFGSFSRNFLNQRLAPEQIIICPFEILGLLTPSLPQSLPPSSPLPPPSPLPAPPPLPQQLEIYNDLHLLGSRPSPLHRHWGQAGRNFFFLDHAVHAYIMSIASTTSHEYCIPWSYSNPKMASAVTVAILKNLWHLATLKLELKEHTYLYSHCDPNCDFRTCPHSQ